MTPSSDTNSVTTIRAAISRSPLLQLVAYRFLLTPEHLHSPGRRRRGTLRSALDPVVHVGDAVLPLEDPGALQLDLLGSEALEQTAPLAEEHRDDMELDLVEDAGSERELRGSGAVDQHVLYARSLVGLGHRTRDVGHIGDQRPLPPFRTDGSPPPHGRHKLMLPGTDRTQLLMPSGGGPPGIIGYRSTRYARCVTPSVSVSPVCSSSIRCGSRSNRRRPPPSRTLIRWIRISSTRPAARNCWSKLAPMSPIRLSPATSWAFARAPSIPSVTKVNTGSALAGGLWVTTKHGTTSPNGPLPPQASIELSYDRRPMITAPVSSTSLPYTRSNTDGSSNAQLWSRIPSSPSPCSGLSLGAAM